MVFKIIYILIVIFEKGLKNKVSYPDEITCMQSVLKINSEQSESYYINKQNHRLHPKNVTASSSLTTSFTIFVKRIYTFLVQKLNFLRQNVQMSEKKRQHLPHLKLFAFHIRYIHCSRLLVATIHIFHPINEKLWNEMTTDKRANSIGQCLSATLSGVYSAIGQIR